MRYRWDFQRKRECKVCHVAKDQDKDFGTVKMFDVLKGGRVRYYTFIRLDCKVCRAKHAKEMRYKKFLERGQFKLYNILMK